jgi:hypothetical protein
VIQDVNYLVRILARAYHNGVVLGEHQPAAVTVNGRGNHNTSNSWMVNVNFMSFSRALRCAGLFEDVFDDVHFVFFAVVIDHVDFSLLDGELDGPVHGEVGGLGPAPPQSLFRQVGLGVVFDGEGWYTR